MKTPLILLLTLSLALNATFAWFLVRPKTDQPVQRTARVAPRAVQADPVTAEAWSALQPEALPAFVEQLRAAGFPPDMVRAVLAAQLSETFAARRKAIAGASDQLPYWKDGMRDPKIQAALVQLGREQEKIMRTLLGAEAESDDPLTRLYRNRDLSYLPADKAEQIRQLQREHAEQRSDLFAAGFNSMTDRAKMTALDKEQHEALARVLSPAELLEYNLRASNTASTLREELSAFNPTEQEFRALYQLRAPFNDRFNSEGGLVLSSDPNAIARRDAQKLLTEQIRVQLGPERAAEYERMTDYNYRRTSQLVARLELPPATTNQLFAIQKEFEQRRNDLYRGSPGSTREAITEQVTALQKEAVAKVTPLLGSPNAVEAYKQYGGSWLASMVPRPAIPAPRPPAPKS